MTESEISYWVATTQVPGWQQSKASKEQLEAIALRQQRMIAEGRTSWLTYPDGTLVEEV